MCLRYFLNIIWVANIIVSTSSAPFPPPSYDEGEPSQTKTRMFPYLEIGLSVPDHTHVSNGQNGANIGGILTGSETLHASVGGNQMYVASAGNHRSRFALLLVWCCRKSKQEGSGVYNAFCYRKHMYTCTYNICVLFYESV